MSLPFIRPALAIGILLAATACTSYGEGRGYGYSSRDRYYDDYSDNYGGTYFGWYDNFYYPGVGVYLYDRSGNTHRWNDNQRRYWEGRRDNRYQGRENWDGYRDRDRDNRGDRRDGRRRD